MPEWVLVILHTLVAIVVLFVMTKLLGKRQVSQLSLFEYITGITIGSLAAYIPLESRETWYLGVISLVVWSLVSLVIEYVQIKSKKFRDTVDGTGTVLIKDGKVLEDHLRKERVTMDELMSQLRRKGAFKVADVEFAVMENSGEINILLTKENQPLTPKMIGLALPPEKEPQSIVVDGEIQERELSEASKDKKWLQSELGKRGVELSDVFLAQVESNGRLHLDLYDDKLQSGQPAQSNSLLDALESCQEEYKKLAANAEDQHGKQIYEEGYAQMTRLIKETRNKLNTKS
ncbi:DUF421 domain-containing protein [Paenibacillus medicaginis]|uniref:DUF421 domain-containing protein n=1 Tax=Paenibacillus medicaginis TaxID=1470560 RepID=A0ABV5BZY3_9BACL